MEVYGVYKDGTFRYAGTLKRAVDEEGELDTKLLIPQPDEYEKWPEEWVSLFRELNGR